MKKTKQESKPKTLGVLSSALIGSLMCVTASTAYAQSATGAQNFGSVQGTQQISKQQYVQEKQPATQQARPVPSENRVPLTAGDKTGVTQQGAKAGTAASTNKQAVAPVSMEQLKYQRNQAAQKGQSTATYDKAIQEHITNQAK